MFNISNRIGLYLSGAACVALALMLIFTLGAKNAAESRAERLQGERDYAVEQWNRCIANRSSLEAAVKAQSQSIEALGRESEARIAESQRLASAAGKSLSDAKARADRLASKGLVGAGTCERMLEADDALLEALK